MKFEENLRAFRVNRFLTQADVCKALHLTRSVYASYEKGIRMPSVTVLAELAKFYGVRIDAFFNYDTAQFMNDLNLLSAMSEQERHLLVSFSHLSDFAKGKLLERLSILEAQDSIMYPTAKERRSALSR